jgi:maltose alpha-D-glucosyltransferase/alpha-amylase
MQWSPDRNAGFSRTNPQKLYMPVIIDPEYHYESLNVENQQRNPASFLWWMKRAIALRKGFKSPGRGDLEFVLPDNPRVLAFVRKYREESILVIANLSRYYQVAQIDLSHYAGCIPEEIFSRNRFPVIKETPYVFTLGPHSYLLLLLRKEEEALSLGGKTAVPELRTTGSWEKVLERKTLAMLENVVIPNYLMSCRWFGGKAKKISQVSIAENLRVVKDTDFSCLLFLEVRYTDGSQDLYLLPLSFALTRKGEQPLEELVVEGERVRLDYEWMTIRAKMIMEEFPQAILARLHVDEDEGILYDAAYDSPFREALLALIARRRRIKGQRGELVGFPGKAFRRMAGTPELPLNSQALKAEQSNTSILFEDQFYFKLFRGLKEGMNPDQEITQFLTEKTDFSNIPPYAGSIAYQQPGAESILIGLLQGFVPNQGDAWSYTQDVLGRYFEQVLSIGATQGVPPLPGSLFDIDLNATPPLLRELIEGHYLEMVTLLGKRTAEMHLALASLPEENDFAPERFSMLYQRSLFQSMRAHLRRVAQALRNNLKNLSEPLQKEASFLLGSEQKILDRFRKILDHKFSAMRIRIHGDYHLGQVLYTGKDFVIIDFEGEPARALSERRLKHSPFKDVAGMVRSFHYASYNSLRKEASLRPDDLPILQPWADLWYQYLSRVYLKSYLDRVTNAPFIPSTREEVETMFQLFVLEKAVYELGYELNNRPEWVMIPLRSIRSLLEGG